MQTGFALPQAHALFARSAFRYGSPSPPSNTRIPLLRQYVSSSLLPCPSNRGGSALATPCNIAALIFCCKNWLGMRHRPQLIVNVSQTPASLAFTDCATKALIIKITNDMIKGLRQRRIGPRTAKKAIYFATRERVVGFSLGCLSWLIRQLTRSRCLIATKTAWRRPERNIRRH